MKYQGSKDGIAKYILPFVLRDRKPDQWYVEPFVGGANMIDKVTGNRIGSDVNEYVIEALKLIRDDIGSLPKYKNDTDEETYKSVRKINGFDKGVIGYYGFALSFGGKWFGGWCRDSQHKRDYIAESFKNALIQSKKIQGVQFLNSSYNDLDVPDNSIIYCDPPYKQTTEYKTKGFDHDKFWQWCREKRKQGHKVYISEYQAPDDFIDIWQIEKVSSLAKDTGSKKGREKLFVHKDDYNNQFYF